MAHLFWAGGIRLNETFRIGNMQDVVKDSVPDLPCNTLKGFWHPNLWLECHHYLSQFCQGNVMFSLTITKTQIYSTLVQSKLPRPSQLSDENMTLKEWTWAVPLHILDCIHYLLPLTVVRHPLIYNMSVISQPCMTPAGAWYGEVGDSRWVHGGSHFPLVSTDFPSELCTDGRLHWFCSA